MYLPTEKTLAAMIGEAMKDRAPKLYADLKAEGMLESDLMERATEALEAFHATTERVDLKWEVEIGKLPYLENVAAREAKLRAEWEVVLAEAIEFPPEDSQESEEWEDEPLPIAPVTLYNEAAFDDETYQQARPHIEVALAAFTDAGLSFTNMVEFLIANLGGGVSPYLIRFAMDSAPPIGAGIHPGAPFSE